MRPRSQEARRRRVRCWSCLFAISMRGFLSGLGFRFHVPGFHVPRFRVPGSGSGFWFAVPRSERAMCTLHWHEAARIGAGQHRRRLLVRFNPTDFGKLRPESARGFAGEARNQLRTERRASISATLSTARFTASVAARRGASVQGLEPEPGTRRPVGTRNEEPGNLSRTACAFTDGRSSRASTSVHVLGFIHRGVREHAPSQQMCSNARVGFLPVVAQPDARRRGRCRSCRWDRAAGSGGRSCRAIRTLSPWRRSARRGSRSSRAAARRVIVLMRAIERARVGPVVASGRIRSSGAL
jgi:hypothetical protein